MNKKTVLHGAVIYLLVCTTTAHAYWWRFNNFTNKILLIRVTLLANNSPHYAIVFPSMSALFDWSPPHPLAGFCFGTVQWITVPRDILYNKDLVAHDYRVIDDKKMEQLFFGNDAPFTLNKAHITYFPSELYKKTAQHAGAFTGKTFMKWAAKLHAQSKCRSRHIFIMEDEQENISFLAQKN